MEACAMGGNKMPKNFRFLWLTIATATGLAAAVWSSESTVQSRVPHFQTSDRCVACHNGLATRAGEDISMGLSWQPTMMANSARDPYWHAGVRRESIEHPESRAAIEDECSICHMPMARFESKSGDHEGTVFSHLRFLPEDRGDQLAADGVSCSLCHQIGKEKLGTRESFVGNFVIGGPNVQGNRMEFGPYAPDAGHIRIMQSSTGGFLPTESTHIRESELCATCHTLITKALGPGGKTIGELPEQVPYQEWLHSGYRKIRSCQSCHMPVVQEDVAITSVQGLPRTGVSRHVFLGGNFFMNGILNRYRNELNVQALPDELTGNAKRTKDHLQSEAARITIGKLEEHGGRLETEVVIENFGGHKLPTAYPSRRVWLHVVVRDKNNRAIFESGAVNSAGAITDNDNDTDAARFEPHYNEIRSAGQVQIYEAIMADSGGGVTTGLLNAVRYVKDNRLLPRGFDKKTADADIAVAGSALEDVDFDSGADRVRFTIDLGEAQGPFRIEVELCYQPIGYRWAMNLKQYNADETQRFTAYYEAASASSMLVLAQAHTEQ
jgi:hypothetical protein